MVCPECNRSFDGAAGACPRCRSSKGVIRTSTILISRGEVRNVYRSVDEVPEALKRQLLRSTNGLNSATIVIADRQGRKEIAKAIRSLPAPAPASRRPPDRPGWNVPQLIGAVALGAALALVWLILH